MIDRRLKEAFWISAAQRNLLRGIDVGLREPRIVRCHVDGPYAALIDGRMHWLTPWERLLTKLGIWDAWDIEARRHWA